MQLLSSYYVTVQYRENLYIYLMTRGGILISLLVVQLSGAALELQGQDDASPVDGP